MPTMRDDASGRTPTPRAAGPCLLPAIDLRGGRVVRLTQGDYERQTTYADDPIAVARSFERAFVEAEADGDAGGAGGSPRWLHVVDLDAAKSGALSPGTRETLGRLIEETSLSVEFGGGVRGSAIIDELLGLGVARVVVGSAALKDWDWFRGLMDEPRLHGRIALGLDAKDGRVAVSGWTRTTDTLAVDLAREVRDWPLGAIIYTDIATDGTLAGPNVPATRAIAEAAGCGPGSSVDARAGVGVIASGGVGTLEHVRELAALPVAGVIVGRAIYEGTVSVLDAIRVLRGDAANGRGDVGESQA